LSDQLCLVVAYDSIGDYETVLAILQGLMSNQDYILDPIENAWALLQDIEHERR